jgi:LmbE family N-acetylglucosaminyl deacetylase
LSPSLKLTPADRLLLLAPHPDDESLATGGLLQRAVRVGAEVRVIFISDGDDNPWPQRMLERRWRIGPSGRQRWGSRRRQEAVAALRVLGIPEDRVHFLGLPDQGTTDALLEARESSIELLLSEVEKWRPTVIAAPSPHDVHPDHNALAVQLRLALARTHLRPRLLNYVVHRHGEWPRGEVALRLTPEECAIKREAILCHETQMALSRRRFLAYVRKTEPFFLSDDRPARHPIRGAHLEAGALCLRLYPTRIAPGRLLFVFESLAEGSVRWVVSLQRRSGVARIHDARTGSPRRRGTVRCDGDLLEVRIPLAPLLPITRLFVKYDRRIAFYDHAGWLEIPVGAAATPPCSAPPFSATSSSSRSFAPSSFGGVSAGLD